ncbi:MAG TPA: AAA family ATPase [Solirubrobacteraceae bacterium]
MAIDSGAPPVVGRERELAVLDEVLERLAETGMLGCVALVGDPGMGKTRLLTELRARADARGHLCLAGSSAEFERDLPFGVWEDALDAHLATLDAATWDREVLDELAAMLPALRTEGAPRPAVPDERYRVHRAMRALLERLAADRPLVVVLDDLHWSDEASIELISSVVQRGVDAPVLLALGIRTGQIPAGLNSALAAPAVVHLPVEPLGEKDALLVAGDAVDDARRREIFAESGGNPFYIEQLARAAPAQGPRAPGADVGTGVPPAVASALAQELAGLDRRDHRFLEGAAVAGDPFDPELAGEIAGLGLDDALDALDALLASRLLRPTDVPRRFAFRHPLVRRAVYEASPSGWLLGAHGRAAATLAAQGATASARAHHVEQSAGRGDAEAIALLLSAGLETAGRAPASAARWYEAALRLMPEADRGTRVETLVGLAGALRHVGDLHGSHERLLEATALLPPEEVTLRVALTSACAVTETFMGRHESAKRRLAGALAELPERRSPEGVAVLLSLAGEYFFTAQIAEMWEVANDALAIARSLSEPALVASAAAVVAHAGFMHGELEPAEAARAEASELLAALSDAELALRLEEVNRLGWAEFYGGLYAASMERLERGIAVSRASGRGEFIPLMTQASGLGAMMLGRLDEAAELHERSLEGARLSGNPYMTCAALITSAQVAWAQGDSEAAVRAAREGVALAKDADSGVIPALCATVQAVLMLEAGESPEAAERVVERAGGWELPLLPTLWQARNQEGKARADIAAGRLDDAEAAAARAEAAAARCSIPISHAHALRARAAVLLARGEPAAAADAALASAASADAAEARIEAAASRMLAGRAVGEAGHRDDGVELLRGAERTLDDCGAAGLRDEARRHLRKLGVRAGPRGPRGTDDSGVGALTKREREIADLVWDRQTNREIAAGLFLSEKTVESHLRNIFFKLGVSSRVEVARAIDAARSDPR